MRLIENSAARNIFNNLKESESIPSMKDENFNETVLRDFRLFLMDKYGDELYKDVTDEDVNEYFTGMFYDIWDNDDLDSANAAEDIIRAEYHISDKSDFNESEDSERILAKLVKDLPDTVEYKGKTYQAFNVMSNDTTGATSKVYYCNMENTPNGDPQESNDYFFVVATLKKTDRGYKGVDHINYVEDLTEGVSNRKHITESASDRYQVREFDGPGAKFGVYDTKQKKFIQKGSKKVMIASCDELNKRANNKHKVKESVEEHDLSKDLFGDAAANRMSQKEKDLERDLQYVRDIMAGKTVIDDKYHEELSLDTAKAWLRNDFIYVNELSSYSSDEVNKRLADAYPDIFSVNESAKLNEDSKIWSNTGTEDYYSNLSREEMIQEIKDNGWDEEEINGKPILDADDDELREFLTPYDIDLDYEDYENSILPMIENQCYGDYIVLTGIAANWRGKGEACKAIKLSELGSYLMPSYDSHTVLYCDNQDNLYYTEATHDTPMGGTQMYLYGFYDETAYNNAEKELQKLFDDEDFDMYYFCDYLGYKETEALIKLGLLNPIKRDPHYVGRVDEGHKLIEDDSKYELKETARYATNIDWETDGDDEVKKELPKKVEIPQNVTEDTVADWLSDKYGWLVNSVSITENANDTVDKKPNCVIFYLNGKELGGHDLKNEFEGERESAKELFAYENGVKPEEIEERLEYRESMNESVKSKKSAKKQPKENKRVIMQQGNVTCFKENDNTYYVFENENDNEVEHDSEESAMHDFLERVGIDADAELKEK